MFLDFPSVAALARAVQRRRVSPTEVVAHSLAAIEREQPRLNAFITVMGESAMAAARALERRIARGGDPGMLAGVPVGVKDLILTRDAPTTAGSRIHGEGITGQGDAPVVARLRRAGAVMIGKCNLHEVALGVTSVNEHFGPVRNPWDPELVAGGSSGGSAVAVAAELCPAAIGTDTRGSIRIPAACCGITGFKPTYGLVDVEGVLPLAESLDHVGPMTRSVEDAALLLAGMVAGERLRATLAAAPRRATRRLVVGVSEYHLRDLDGRVAKVVDVALRELRKLVKDVRTVRMPGLEGVQEASGVIASAEAVTLHDENLRLHPDRFGPMVRGRLEGGYKRSAVDYIRALQTQRAVKAAFADAFGGVDLLVGATLPALPARIDDPMTVSMVDRTTLGPGSALAHARWAGDSGSTPPRTRGSSVVSENTVEAYTRFNGPQNMAGLPALSVPCGFAGGLPVGLQLFGARGADVTVLALGGAWQRATDWHRRTPPRPT